MDENGRRAFSNCAPRGEFTDLKVSDAYVPDGRPSSNRSRFTPITFRNNQVLVPVRFGHGGHVISALLLLDTGATSTVLHRDLAYQLGLRPLRYGTSRLADGRTIGVGRAAVDYLNIGPHRLNKLEVGIIDHRGPSAGEEGLLGMDFLKRFPYDLDLTHKKIIWRDTQRG